MEQHLEILVILGIIAIAIAFLVKRFVFKKKPGDCNSGCNCPKPDLPKNPR
ncbi:MAG: FeoB-associated Cys-rich membrane protein [Opitutaceae bacterium]|nr:FeoB-associated Cys-rich membrane protein [Opitutaceae bacterium]